MCLGVREGNRAGEQEGEWKRESWSSESSESESECETKKEAGSQPANLGAPLPPPPPRAPSDTQDIIHCSTSTGSECVDFKLASATMQKAHKPFLALGAFVPKAIHPGVHGEDSRP